MSKIILFTVLAFSSVSFAADPFRLDCKVTGTKTEVTDKDLAIEDYAYLASILSSKSARISVDNEYAVLEIFDANKKAIEFTETKYDGTTGRTTYNKTEKLAMKSYVSKGYKKRGEIAFYNDEAAPVDSGYGAYFHLVFKKSDLKRASGKMDVRIWTAAGGEPTDSIDGGLIDSSNVFMSCAISK